MLIHADNFSIYGTSTSLLTQGVYIGAGECSLVTDPDGISSGRVLRVSGQNTNGLRFALPSIQATVGIASRTWLESLPTQSANRPNIQMFKTAANGNLVSVVIEANGAINVYRGDRAGTLLGSTVVPVITAQGWWHIETKVTINSTTGSVEIRVEGIEVLKLENVNTGSTSVGIISVGDVPSAPIPTTLRCKDLVIWDTQGDYNDDFLGTVLVHTLLPDEDIALNWTPSTGSEGWPILDNIPPVDGQYISAPYNPDGPPDYPNPYVGALTELPEETTSVKGIISFVRAAKSDGGDGSIQVGIISDPDNSPETVLGTDRPITVAQTYWRDVFEEDPKTEAPWTPAAVNIAHLQINRTT